MLDVGFQLDGLSEAIDSIDRLTCAVERLGIAVEALGPLARSRYTNTPESNGDLVDEGTMAEMLKIKRRSLGEHRRKGKLPSCWLKNGRRVFWNVSDTLEAWKQGIA